MTERLRPLDPIEWSEEVRRLLGGTLEGVETLEGSTRREKPRPLNILLTIAHHPQLLGPFLAFAATLAIRGVLSGGILNCSPYVRRGIASRTSSGAIMSCTRKQLVFRTRRSAALRSGLPIQAGRRTTAVCSKQRTSFI